MAGCGYVCPVCEGKGYLPDATACTYCTDTKSSNENLTEQEWIQTVHQGKCCADE